MVVNKDLEFPMDAKSNGYIFMPVNLQGLMELTSHERRFKYLFPDVYKQYVSLCIDARVNQGDIRLFKSGAHEIILAFNELYVFRKTEENKKQNDLFLSLAIQKVIDRNLPLKVIYYPKITLSRSKERIIKDITYNWICLED